MLRSRMVMWLISSFAAVLMPACAEISTNAEHAILMDAQTGQVLWAKDGYVAMPPASMSKLMTLEVLFQRLKDGRVKLTDSFPVSERAWRTGGSTGFVRVGDRLAVDDLIQRIAVVSGNDACVVVAEALGGSVEHFAEMMNRRAKELGLKNSQFVNPDGLPDPPGQMMSAYDLAQLARHLIRDYPQYYHYFSIRSYTVSDFKGRPIVQPNRNMALEYFPGTDGLKTGHTDAAGYGVTVSALLNGQRLILVLNGLRYPDLDKKGGPSADWFAERRRGEEAARVFGMAFREFRSYPLFKEDEIIGEADVWGGSSRKIPVTVGKALAVTLQVESRAKMKVVMHYNSPLQAPIRKGQQVGTLTVTAPDFPAYVVPVVATKDVAKAGIFGRIWMGIEGLTGHGK
jgi:serine-type D-Ala-D-Ala carboxypeptidase (penicillin-binding protein 5/6)